MVSELVHLVGFLYPKCDPRPLLAMDEAMEKAMLNCGSNVCDNDSMIMFEDCPNNELLELLKQRNMLECLFTCWNILKIRTISYTIVYVSQTLWLRSTKEGWDQERTFNS